MSHEIDIIAALQEAVRNKEGCKYCQRDNNYFITLNDTGSHSGIWMALNRQGMFRVRYFDDHDNLEAMDILNINFCPMCGRKLRG